MTQTGIIENMAIIYGMVAAILTYAWIRGIVEPTPAALELLQQAHDDYASAEAVAIRQRAADRAALDNRIAAEQRIRAQQMREETARLANFHRDGTDGVQ